MALAHIAFGGNLPESSHVFGRAAEVLHQRFGHVVARSSIWSSDAMGADAGAEFVNAAVSLRTQSSPSELLQQLHAIEQVFGRTREVHWGPRILDLDLLLYDQLTLEDPEISVPHPAMWYRDFVLNPLSEIAAGAVHPLLGITVQQLCERISRRPIRFVWHGAEDSGSHGEEHLARALWQRSERDDLDVLLPELAEQENIPTVAGLRPVVESTRQGYSQPRHASDCIIELATTNIDSPWDDRKFVERICDVVDAIDSRTQVVNSPSGW